MKVLIYHKKFTSFLAGGAFQPLTLIAELQKSCEVTLALNEGADLSRAADMSGIPIDADRLRIEVLDTPTGFASRHEWYAAIMRSRRLQTLARDADVCISTANVVDFGKHAHHFVYLLSQFAGAAFYDYLMGRGGGFGPRRVMRRLGTAFYENVVKPLFGVRPTWRIFADRGERIYPTSKYVDGILRGYFGPFNSTVFYPPTTFEFHDTSVPRDPLLAIYVGRIFPPKRITEMVDIVEKARRKSGQALKFHVAGELVPSAYVDHLKALASERPWFMLVGPVYGPDKERFMLSATYALHAERDEAFGIAIAEYLKAGCIPVVPDVGGPSEIVCERTLEFARADDASDILAKLISDHSLREDMRRRCSSRAEEFTVQAYMDREKRLVAEIISKKERECR